MTRSPARTVVRTVARPVARALALAAALTAGALAPPAAGQTFDAEARAAAVERIGALLTEHYVFADKGAECAARLEQALADGELDLSSPDGFAAAVTERLQAVTDDKHLRCTPSPGPAPGEEVAGPSDEEREAMRQRSWLRGREQNFGFENVLRLPGNVGVLDLRSFQPVDMAGDTARAAMTYLANSDALIVDLRQNGGGDPEMVQLLCSYLFDEPTHLNSLYWRAGDETEEFWTLDQEALPGPRLPDLPVFVLTSRYTFSGAEEYSYNLRTRERATLIGETTGGGAHPGEEMRVSSQLGLFVPQGRAINPITGTNWEGTGVEPHIQTSAKAAMGKAVELATKAAQDHRDAREAAGS